jgi:hypothetical protein
VPIGWGKREEKAVESTIGHIQDPAIAENRLGVKPNYDSVDSYAEASGALMTMQRYEAFIRALPLCVPMTIGFHAKDGESKSCYCPCSKAIMLKWNHFCSVHLTDDSACKLTRLGKSCCELLQHAKDVGKPDLISKRTKHHYIIYQYLKSVFENYCARGHTQLHWAIKNAFNGIGQQESKKKRKWAKAEVDKPAVKSG